MTGTLSDDNGNTLEYFDWKPKRPGLKVSEMCSRPSAPPTGVPQFHPSPFYLLAPQFGPSKSQKLFINPCLSFLITSQTDLLMSFRSSAGFQEFNVGKPSRVSYMDKIKTKTLTGHLILDLPDGTPTLKERQGEIGRGAKGGWSEATAKTPYYLLVTNNLSSSRRLSPLPLVLLAANPAAANMKKAQEFGWTLPRASPSGREYAQITVRPSLQPVINDGNDSIDKLSNFRTTIGENVLGLKTLLRETAKDPNASVNLGGTGKSRGLQVPPAVYKKFIPPPPLPEMVKNTKLISHVASESPSQLVVVLCSDRGAGECRRAEKEYAKLYKKTNEVCKKRGVEGEKHMHKLIVCDCSKQPDCIAKKYNFNVYPMVIMYYGGKLVFIGDRFNGFGTATADFEKEIEKQNKQAR